MTYEDLDLLEQYYNLKAKDDFYTFRRLVNPKAKVGWFYKDITAHLQQFYEDLISGKKPKLILQAPPQHGKSEAVTEFVAWLSGKNPDYRTIYASFSERLGVRANLKLQRIMTSKRYQAIFNTKLGSKKDDTLKNKDILEFAEHDGYFRNTTVQGSITGEGLDLGIIDDPIKGREQANSLTFREKAWDWFTDDFFTRFSEDAGLLMILTRWHVDDPAGRMINKFGDKIKVVTYQAIAMQDEVNRNEGEPLFPELKSLEFLMERKNTMPPSNFEALYQQHPTMKDGEMVKLSWFRWYDIVPKIKEKAIFVDTAQKKGEKNDYTVAQCWGYDGDNIFLLDMIRVKENAPEAQRLIEAFYEKHRNDKFRKMYIEDKSSGSTMIQIFNQRKMLVEAIQRNVDKVQRLNLTSGYIEMGKVYLSSKVNSIDSLIDEAVSFPNGAHDDTLDPMMDAITKYLINTRIDYGSLL